MRRISLISIFIALALFFGVSQGFAADMFLEDDTITSGETVTKTTDGTIYAGPSYTIESNAEVTFKASGEIILSPGFTAKEGSEFSAFIDGSIQSLGINTVTGTVQIDGSNMPWALVTLSGTDLNGNTIIMTTQADANGNYTFDGVPEGTYTVSAEYYNYASQVPVIVPVTGSNRSIEAGAIVAEERDRTDYEVGSIPGSFNVDQNGAAKYTMPIKTPPGINGVEPHLAITYSSRKGNGLLGMGFALSGISSITRCPSTIMKDTFVDGVDFDSSDRFCLNGQTLVSISGTYGANGTEYRTEIETFSKIVSYGNTGGGPTSFKVWTKDGLIMEYGNTDDSKIHVQNDTGILLWTLNRIKDRNGNEMNFTYASDGQNQEFWPTRIEYAYVNGTARCYVAFEYDDARPDSETRYVAGSPRRTTKLLRNIKTYAGNYLVKNYLLDYEGGSTYRSRLKRVTECRDADECLPPTTFAWQDTEPGFDSVDIDAPDYLFDNTIIGDFNGDGKKDLARPGNLSKAMVMLSNGNGFDAAANWGGFIFPPPGSKTGDANGDGKTDILGSLNDSISKKDQDGFSTRLASSLPYLAADFNGDGRDDIFFNYSQDDWKIQRSNGTSFVNWLTLTIDKDLEDSTLDTGDFNGDGVADIIQFERTVTEIIILGEISTLISEKWSVLLSNEGGFNDKQTWVDEGLDEDSIIDEHFLGDFNGDGKTDVLIFNSENDANVSYVRFSNGEGFEPKTQFNTDHVSLSAKLGDFNGDGKTDILQVEEGNSYVWFSTGSGFVKSDIAWGADHSDEDLVGDFNGDGRTDVIQLGKNLTEIQWVDCSQGGIPLVCPEEVEVVEYTYYLWCSKPGSPDLITGITTGLGAETNITYTPITDSEVYTRYCTADYPLKDYQGAMNVVSYYNVSNGIGGSNEYSYTYEGATVDVERRRFQGFSKITEFDHQKSITTQTAYITRYPFTGMISSRVISDQSHTILSMGNIYEAYSYLNGTASGPFAEGAPINPDSCFFPYVKTSETSDYYLTGQAIKTTTITNVYDTYGNNSKTTVSASTGSSTYTEVVHHTTIDNIVTGTTIDGEPKWYIGLVRRTERTCTDEQGTSKTSKVAYTYDDSGRLASKTIEPDEASGSPLRLTTAFTYGDYGNISSVTNTGHDGTVSESRTTTYTYEYASSDIYEVTQTNPEGHIEDLTYEWSTGNLQSHSDVNGLVTDWFYDGLGRKVQETRPDESRTEWSYSWGVEKKGDVSIF